jgi:hypothetical protein
VETVGSALGYAHRQGVLHRDIKPSNVLISKDNVMYLADFGLARIAQDGESTLSADSIMGTPQYISPEQAMGKKDLDGKTDIYSFGVMLYEMVVGQVPFNADTPFSIIHDHIYTPLPLPQVVNPKVPEPVQRVLLKALAKNHLDRYETVEELIAAFKIAWHEAGMPMRGADITMAPNAVKAGNLTAATRAHSVKQAEVVNPPKSPKKKRSAWMWVAVGLVIVMCLVVGLFALRNTFPNFLRRLAANNRAQVTQVPLGQAQPLPPGNLPTPTSIPVEQLTPEIEAAYKQVGENPSDPDAHLQLSLALFDAKFELAAVEELGRAADLAGRDEDFYVNAAHEYESREAWHLAASMYLRLMPIYTEKNQPIPEEIKDGFREAAYKGAERRDMPLLVPFDQINILHADFASVVRGRYALYNGALADAEASLASAERASAFLPEVHLLKAEIAIKKGNINDARDILLALGGDPKASEWILSMSEELLKSIQ